ncbi:MAG: START-like domain-containing protein, partial [Bacteroidia bacterium]
KAPASKSKVAPPQPAPAPKKPAPKAPQKPAPAPAKTAGAPKTAAVAAKPAPAPAKTAPAPKKEGKTSDKKAKKAASDDDEPIPEIIPIEQLPVLPSDIHYKRPKGKLAPGAKRLVRTETINPHVIKDKPIEPEKVVKKKEPEGKFEMEFVLHAPIGLLYDFLTTPSGLAEWFADDVDLKNDIYTFNWDGSKQHARIDAAKLDSFIRLHWMDKPEGTYFEFRILADELTNEISLMITDFGDGDDDVRTSRQLWQAQIQRLIKSMGTY